MKIVLQYAYGFAIVGTFLAFGLVAMLLVQCCTCIFKKRKCVRPTRSCIRFFHPAQYFISSLSIFTGIMAGSAMELWSIWISFVFGGIFILAAYAVYVRQTVSKSIRHFGVQEEAEAFLIDYPEDNHTMYTMSHKKQKDVGFLRSIWKGIKTKPLIFIFMIFFSFSASAFFTFGSDGICIAVRPVDISTRFTRYVAGDHCKKHTVCHTYFTLADDPSTSTIINFHTRDLPLTATVSYNILNSSIVTTVEARWNKMDIEVPRYVLWADIIDLVPGTIYQFTPSYSTGESIFIKGETRMIKTVPLTGNVTFVTGGDMENDESGWKISEIAGSKSPYFAMLGGDVAYANGNRNCYRRWDDWFKAWMKWTKTPEGFDVPMSIALGNHEAGGDHGDRDSIGFFLAYFPQTLGLYNTPTNERPIYHSHSMGNHSTMMVLDSGIVESMRGDQLEWMENHLNNTKAINRFAIYHYSLYPSIPEEEMITSEDRKSWVDIFGRYNMTAGFENHYHVFKRTKTIRFDESVDSPNDGTTYFGDGAWGINSANPFMNGKSWWIKSVARTPHFYLVTTSETMVTVEAINSKDKIFDSFVLKR